MWHSISGVSLAVRHSGWMAVAQAKSSDLTVGPQVAAATPGFDMGPMMKL